MTELHRTTPDTADRPAAPEARRTKIVATLGPATQGATTLERLVEAGMDVARINLSHGSLPDHERSIAEVRRAAMRHGSPLAVLIDLPGPKLRLGDLARPISVKQGETIELGASAGADVPVNFPDLLAHLTPGEVVLVDDGAVAFRVRAVTPPTVVLEALNDGRVESHKGVNLPDTQLPISALTDADRDFLTWALRQDVDYVLSPSSGPPTTYASSGS